MAVPFFVRRSDMLRISVALFVALVAVAPASIIWAPPVHADAGTTLVIGRITTEPRKHFDRLRAMAKYLAARLAGDGISGVEVVMVDSVDKMRALLRDGQVDIISETPFVAFELAEQGLATLLLREWKKGVPQYHSVIVARKDGPVRRLEDLRGRRFAFEDHGSTSGYMLPRAAIEMAGFRLHELDGPRDPVPEDAVGYSFADGEINVIAWVNRGLADAGAISNLDWNDPATAPPRFREALTVIHETPPIIRSILVVRSTLDAAHRRRLTEVLERMHEDAEGRKVLKAYFAVSRFDRLDGDALPSLQAAQEIWRRTRGFAN